MRYAKILLVVGLLRAAQPALAGDCRGGVLKAKALKTELRRQGILLQRRHLRERIRCIGNADFCRNTGSLVDLEELHRQETSQLKSLYQERIRRAKDESQACWQAGRSRTGAAGPQAR